MNSEYVIELIDLEKSFGKQKVLKRVNLSVVRGKTTVIVGESGQGKSVIIKHILGLIKPDRGRVMVLGKDINQLRRKELKEIRTKFGVLFQGVALFDSMTVYDNIALPLRERTGLSEEAVRLKVVEKLELMDLNATINKYPAQLSGGMRKRIGLARALQLEPEIVIFDEPTTGLDPAKTRDIYQLFFATQEKLGYTSIIVSHDIPKIFNLADYVAVLHNGIIQECVTPEEIQRSDNPLIKEFIQSTMGTFYSSDTVERCYEKI